MKDLHELKNKIKYQDYYIKDINNEIIFSGDVVYTTLNKLYLNYFMLEYVKYKDEIIPLLYTLHESYHIVIYDERGIYRKNNISLLTKTNIFSVKNLSKHYNRFFTKMYKSIKYRLNWDDIPNLEYENVYLFCDDRKNNFNIFTKSAYIKLTNKKHIEYLWKVK